ncbi:Magnesium chelatase, subunit ChlI C-terminal [Variovorax sp. OV329]|nr:Magnesium chelatase, subunit ChlI C-terminal [Variovorax sp. OV329]
MPAIPPQELLEAPAGEASAAVRERVARARQRAIERQGQANHGLAGSQIDRHAALDAAASQLLHKAASKFGWSARSTHRTLKVARTIADMADSPAVGATHVAEAMQYRRALAATA